MHRVLFGLLLSTSLVGCIDSRAIPPRDSGIHLPDAVIACRSDGECGDGLFCNGVERCDPLRGCLASSAPCAAVRCDESADHCNTDCDAAPDEDQDTYASVACGGLDCNDINASIHPGATELCNGQDDDCDDVVDDGNPCGGRDGGVDSGVVTDPCDTSIVGRNIGSACRTGSCISPLQCWDEQTSSTPTFEADGTAGATVNFELNANGGLCSETCNLDGADTCGECASCSIGAAIGTLRFVADVDAAGNPLGLCRPRCTPSRTNNGGCRAGYTCDLVTGTCIDACTSSEWCRIVDYADVTGDATNDFVYDSSLPVTCSTTTGRCNVTGTVGARASDPCDSTTDCRTGGLCADGLCTQLGCTFAGFECASGEVCDVRHIAATGGCLLACSVGADPVALGTSGRGNTCAVGQACEWDGASSASATRNGSCLEGTYNAVATSNVGASCTTDTDCYSPFGYGRCIFAEEGVAGSGMCAIRDCLTFANGGGTVHGILPGVSTGATPVCAGANETCVNFAETGAPNTFCMRSCTSASDCAAGYACADILMTGDTMCWRYCESSTECRSGESCLDSGGGTCAAGETCTCGT